MVKTFTPAQLPSPVGEDFVSAVSQVLARFEVRRVAAEDIWARCSPSPRRPRLRSSPVASPICSTASPGPPPIGSGSSPQRSQTRDRAGLIQAGLTARNRQHGTSQDDDAIVGAAREELRRRLPELRKLPGCPLGSDDAIVAMSYPPYYTACPNPFIGDWLASLDRPGDEHRADPGPFVSDVSEGKGNAFYKAHSYPTKVPHPAIMRFILHYTKPGDVVLDGFAGTG